METSDWQDHGRRESSSFWLWKIQHAGEFSSFFDRTSQHDCHPHIKKRVFPIGRDSLSSRVLEMFNEALVWNHTVTGLRSPVCFMTLNKHWWTRWSVGFDDVESVKLSSGAEKKKACGICNSLLLFFYMMDSQAEEKAPCRPPNGLSPLENF